LAINHTGFDSDQQILIALVVDNSKKKNREVVALAERVHIFNLIDFGGGNYGHFKVFKRG
jgi:hypothetical protein